MFLQQTRRVLHYLVKRSLENQEFVINETTTNAAVKLKLKSNRQISKNKAEERQNYFNGEQIDDVKKFSNCLITF